MCLCVPSRFPGLGTNRLVDELASGTNLIEAKGPHALLGLCLDGMPEKHKE